MMNVDLDTLKAQQALVDSNPDQPSYHLKIEARGGVIFGFRVTQSFAKEVMEAMKPDYVDEPMKMKGMDAYPMSPVISSSP